MTTLQKRIHTFVRQVLDSYSGAWLAWSDPRGDWLPLLQRVAQDARLGGFSLLAINETTAGEIGGLRARRQVQDYLDRGEVFVLVFTAPPERCGWLWAHTLLAEQFVTVSLREQLMAWGWRPQSLTITDDELALLARQGLQQDPAAWGGGGLQPDIPLLLEVLAGGAAPPAEQDLIFQLTIEQCGLPPLEAPLDDAGLARWRLRALARLLVTQAHQVAPKLIVEGAPMLIDEACRPMAINVLNRWIDSLRLSKGLPDAILEADKIAALAGQLPTVDAAHGPFLSRAAEHAAFANTCTRLAHKTGKELLQGLVSLQRDLERHASGFWGDGCTHPQAIPWKELRRLSNAARQLLDAAPTAPWSKPDDALNWYIGGGWQLDHAGEEVLRTLTRSTPELVALITPLRDAYRARWEKTLIDWSDVWTKAGCPPLPYPTAGVWLQRMLAAPRATAVLVIDALRYDLGATLVQQINDQEKVDRASIHVARAPLPSMTALGMGLALPIPESQLRAEYADKGWRLIDTVSGVNLSIAEERRQWFQQHQGVTAEAMLGLGDVVSKDIPQPRQGRMRLFITDDTIDKLGHDDELEVMGAGMALDRYRTAIMRLRDQGWRRILVVTDHGFIHWSGSAEPSNPPPVAGAVYKSRRALGYPPETSLTIPHALAPGGQWRIVAAPGAANWSAYGGLGYFHGGASLQEWAIPCVQIEWPLEARPVQVTIEPLSMVLSVRPKVTLRMTRGSMFVEDTLPRQVEVLIWDAAATPPAILFRSSMVQVTPDQTTAVMTLTKSDYATAAMGTALRIQVRDALTEEVLDEQSSTLRIELDEWA